MNVKDITTLLTRGYKPGDIKAIGEMAKENHEIIELAKNTNSLDELNELSGLLTEDTAGASDNPPEDKTFNTDKSLETGESDPTPNFKELYEKSQKEIEELKKTVGDIQSKNSKKDNSGNEGNNEDALKDFANACYY